MTSAQSPVSCGMSTPVVLIPNTSINFQNYRDNKRRYVTKCVACKAMAEFLKRALCGTILASGRSIVVR